MIEKIVKSVDGKDSWDDLGTLIIVLYNIEFIEDFGEFNKGYRCDLVVDYNRGELIHYAPQHGITKSVKMELKPLGE